MAICRGDAPRMVAIAVALLFVVPTKAELGTRLFNSSTFCETSPGGLLSLAGLCLRPAFQGPKQPLSIIGAGLPRTGTDSLRVALDTLGYKTYHMKVFLAEPGHLQGWEELLHSGNSSPVFEALARDGYNATLDTPMCGLWAEALVRNPHSKVILTVRDSAEKWLDSFKVLLAETGQGAVEGGTMRWLFPKIATYLDAVTWSLQQIFKLERGECAIEYLPDILPKPRNDSKCIEAYEQHIERVKRTVPSEQLLIFNVKEGYAPLCDFLEVPAERCPDKFPHINSRFEIKVTGAVLFCIRFLWWLPLTPLYKLLPLVSGAPRKVKRS